MLSENKIQVIQQNKIWYSQVLTKIIIETRKPIHY